MDVKRESGLGAFVLHLTANAIREDRERQCTCDTYWHYPLDHNAGCPVAEAAMKLVNEKPLQSNTEE